MAYATSRLWVPQQLYWPASKSTRRYSACRASSTDTLRVVKQPQIHKFNPEEPHNTKETTAFRIRVRNEAYRQYCAQIGDAYFDKAVGLSHFRKTHSHALTCIALHSVPLRVEYCQNGNTLSKAKMRRTMNTM